MNISSKHISKLGLAFVAVAALGLAGCKSDVERMVELEEEKAAAYEKAGDNCDDIAKAAEEFKSKHGAEHKALMEKLSAKFKDDKAAGEKAIEPFKERSDKSKKIIIGTVFKCVDNAAFGKAIKND